MVWCQGLCKDAPSQITAFRIPSDSQIVLETWNLWNILSYKLCDIAHAQWSKAKHRNWNSRYRKIYSVEDYFNYKTLNFTDHSYFGHQGVRQKASWLPFSCRTSWWWRSCLHVSAAILQTKIENGFTDWNVRPAMSYAALCSVCPTLKLWSACQ